MKDTDFQSIEVFSSAEVEMCVDQILMEKQVSIEEVKSEKSVGGKESNVYVIPAMRQQQQISSDSDKISFFRRNQTLHGTQSDTSSSYSSLQTRSSSDSSLSNSLSELSLQDASSSSAFLYPSHQSLDYLSCCVLISGFSPSLALETKENLIKQFYQFGGKSQWFRNHDAEVVLFAFGSNQKAVSAIQQSELRPPLCVILFTEYDGSQALKLEADPGRSPSLTHSLTHHFMSSLVAKELVESFKPDLDSRVANRMITAALGIRRTSTTPRTQQTQARRPSPPRVDAWDD
jgi:hypothetical protein